MSEALKSFGALLYDLIFYTMTSNDSVNYFLYYSSIVLSISGAVALVLLLILHPTIKTRSGQHPSFGRRRIGFCSEDTTKHPCSWLGNCSRAERAPL